MDNYTAIGVAEGFVEAESEEQVVEAWQYILDKGLIHQLQGWFGRTARQYVKNGVIEDKQNVFGFKKD